jgi:hypothetical protein
MRHDTAAIVVGEDSRELRTVYVMSPVNRVSAQPAVVMDAAFLGSGQRSCLSASAPTSPN